ncbi:hypothetical protein Rleg10DRAFT_6663 [Rhizobium leguminosarum bv. trifolii WSM2012]|nr:hypothetical protein Rleg10DRAFT_6663 [Rhizobium leguminosarum bv. trifolii WSM2012]
MTNEIDHLFDAALALDAKLAGKMLKPERETGGDTEGLPEDATEVPHSRDVAASRNGPTESA